MPDSKVTIITVCYNAQNWIQGAIESVLSQGYTSIEYIIIDGGSKDGTLSIINKYKSNVTKIISEKDEGVYDAMNKGVRFSSGEIIYFLNADDRFYDKNVVGDVVQVFKDRNIDIVYGNVEPTDVVDKNQLEAKVFKGDLLGRDGLLKYGCCHQRVFVRKNIFEKIGFFNKRYSIHADWDWILQADRKGFKTVFLDRFIALYYAQGLSFQNLNQKLFERAMIVAKYSSPVEFLGLGLRVLYIRCKNILRNLKNV